MLPIEVQCLAPGLGLAYTQGSLLCVQALAKHGHCARSIVSVLMQFAL